MIVAGDMAKKRISDGTSVEEVQALLLKCIRQLRVMPGADVSRLDRAEAEIAWGDRFRAWLAANPKPRCAIVLGPDQTH